MREQFRVSVEMRSTKPYVAACAYINAGLSILDTHGFDEHNKCTCGKSDCGSPGKHPIRQFFSKGVHSATRSKLIMKKAFEKFPDASLAIALDGMTVVDIDGIEGARSA